MDAIRARLKKLDAEHHRLFEEYQARGIQAIATKISVFPRGLQGLEVLWCENQSGDTVQAERPQSRVPVQLHDGLSTSPLLTLF